MDITKDSIEKKLQEQLEPIYLQVEDYSSGCGLKFDAIIVSKKFEGKQLLARQRLVNDILKDEMTIIHAFTQKTYTPDEWEKKLKTAEGNPVSDAKSLGTCAGACGNNKK